MIIQTGKTCPRCKKLKLFAEFYRDKARKDGLYDITISGQPKG